MANEGLIIGVDYNITKAEAKQNKLNRAMDISRQKAENITKEIKALNNEIDRSKVKEQEYTLEAERLRNRLNKYAKGELDLTDAQVKKESQRYNELVKLIEKEQSHQRSKEKSLASQNLALKKQNAETANIGDQILANNRKQNKFAQSFEKSQKSADRFGKRLKSLIVSALFFSVVTKAFTALRNEFGKLITETGTKTAKLVSQLNENLAVIGRTLYEGARPYIEWILQKLAKITEIIAIGISKALGKDINEMKSLVDQTKKLNKESKGALASFDEIDTLNLGDSGSSKTNNTTENIKYNVDDEDLKETQKKLKQILMSAGLIGIAFTAWKLTNFLTDIRLVADKLSTFAGLVAAILGTVIFIQNYSDAWVNGIDWSNFSKMLLGISFLLGGISTIFGSIGFGVASIISGIFLIVLGVKDMTENGINAKNVITLISGVFLTILGILSLISPAIAQIFGGIGMIVGGVALLATGAINWNNELHNGENTLNAILTTLGTILAVIGLIVIGVTAWPVLIIGALTILGTWIDNYKDKIDAWIASLPLGIYELVDIIYTAAYGVWDFIKNLFKGLFELFTGKSETGLKRIGIALINLLIDALNIVTQGINFLFLPIREVILKIGNALGKDWNINDVAIPKIKRIPQLATGAILPGGSPMLAWVNDQPKGQTYVEGSVDNIVKAFEQYLSGKNFGNTAQDNRPIVLQVDGREIARATRSGNESLGTQTVFGGFANAY